MRNAFEPSACLAPFFTCKRILTHLQIKDFCKHRGKMTNYELFFIFSTLFSHFVLIYRDVLHFHLDILKAACCRFAVFSKYSITNW